MPILTVAPDHFYARPESIGHTPIVGSHIQLDRTQVESIPFVVNESHGFRIDFHALDWKLMQPYLGYDIRCLAPAFRMRVYLWVSKQANSAPVGSKVLGNIVTAPMIWDLHRSDNQIWFATKGDERPMMRLDAGDYWLNLFYYGSSNSTIVNRTTTSS